MSNNPRSAVGGPPSCFLVSPKAGAPLALTHGDEPKLVFPQPGAAPERFIDLAFTHFFLQT